jgi:hypothetical protein
VGAHAPRGMTRAAVRHRRCAGDGPRCRAFIVRNQFHNDPVTLAEWDAQRRVAKTGSQGRRPWRHYSNSQCRHPCRRRPCPRRRRRRRDREDDVITRHDDVHVIFDPRASPLAGDARQSNVSRHVWQSQCYPSRKARREARGVEFVTHGRRGRIRPNDSNGRDSRRARTGASSPGRL